MALIFNAGGTDGINSTVNYTAPTGAAASHPRGTRLGGRLGDHVARPGLAYVLPSAISIPVVGPDSRTLS